MCVRTPLAKTVWLLVAAGCVSPAESYNQRGVALYKAGNHQAALEQFHQAVASDVTSADAYYNLGRTHHGLGRPREAELNYNSCLAFAPDHSKCHHALVVLLLEQDRADEAYQAVHRWINRAPEHPDPLVELAWLEKQKGDAEHCHRLLQEAIALQPRHPRALAELASLYEQEDRLDRALVLYERALAGNPGHPKLEQKVVDLRSQFQLSGSEATIMADRGSDQQVAQDLRYPLRQ